MKKLLTLTILILTVLASLTTVQTSTLAQPQAVSTRTVPLEVKIVFMGLDPATVDPKYMEWNKNYLSNFPPIVTNQIQVGGNDTGIYYQVTYRPIFASSSFKDKFVDFLKSIETVVTSENRWFY
jgi:ABC-type phosphate transport system substrate-binding protein